MTLQIFPDSQTLAQSAADLWAQVARQAVQERGRFIVALSGGSTPRLLYQRLAQPPYQTELPWEQTHVYWGDERSVPSTHPESSYGAALQDLLQHVPILTTNIHRVKGEWDARTAAGEYAGQLTQCANPVDNPGRTWPRFDLVLLGMGSDGHTASLFPGPITEQEQTQPTMPVIAHYEDRPAQRITLTPLVFNDARLILFLVTGANKAETLAAVLHGPTDIVRYPAQRIQPHDGQLVWYIDQPAAQFVSTDS
jgi:6-phosphogluconolactonase